MKVLVVGLGLIGASYAKGLSEKGYQVYGVDNNNEVTKFAMENGFVLDASIYPDDFISEVDMIVLSIYPDDIVPFIAKYQHLFRKDLVITDTCGVKSEICVKCREYAKPATFIGSHPMAGREKVGIRFADPNIFKEATYLVCPNQDDSTESIIKIKDMATALGFGRIYEIDPFHHDKMVAYTSELTHAIAVALVNANRDKDTSNFIGDSYRDLTRIAMINERLWDQLFFNNKKYLLEEINAFEEELDVIKRALLDDNHDLLIEAFSSAKEKRGNMN